MDVAVVIPLYNKAPYIARALESVLAQSVPPSEIIVVDDGSTDGGGDTTMCRTDRRIRLVRQENEGVSAARNRGILEAHSDLIAFLDADDEWTTNFLEAVLRLARKHPECGAYATAYDIVGKGGVRRTHRLKGIPPPPWEGVIPNYFRSATNCPVCSSAVAVPKCVFDYVGSFPVGVSLGEDLDTWCRIALKYRIALSRQTGALCHWDVGGRSHEQRQVPHCDGYRLFDTINRALESAQLPPGATREDLVEYRNMKLIGIADCHTDAGNAACAREHLRRAAGTRRHKYRWLRSWIRSFVPARARTALRYHVRHEGNA